MVYLNKDLLTKNFLTMSHFLFCLSTCSLHDPPVPVPYCLWQQHLVSGCCSESWFHWRGAAWTLLHKHLRGQWLWHQHRAEPVANYTARSGVLLKAPPSVLLFTHLINREPGATSCYNEWCVDCSVGSRDLCIVQEVHMSIWNYFKWINV